MTTVVIMANSITELGGAARVAHVLAAGLSDRGYEVELIGLEMAEVPHAFGSRASFAQTTLLDSPIPSMSDESARASADALLDERLADRLADLAPGIVITTQVWCKEVLDRIPHDGWTVIGQYHSSSEAARLNGDVDRLIASYADADVVTMLTQADADAAVAWGLGQAVAMPNPLAFWPDAPSTLGDLVVTYLGRLSPEKAPGIMADAWEAVAGERHDWRLRFVGSGPLTDEIRARHLPRVQFIEPTANPQSYLLGSSILALPSLVEGLPLAVMEAMACGLPVVAADASAGVRELVQNNVTGLLAVRGDADDFARHLARLMDDEALRGSLGARARQAAQAYRLDAVLDRWELLLRHE
jgi:glycosyltransferase involved in cell wall biosynthesis